MLTKYCADDCMSGSVQIEEKPTSSTTLQHPVTKSLDTSKILLIPEGEKPCIGFIAPSADGFMVSNKSQISQDASSCFIYLFYLCISAGETSSNNAEKCDALCATPPLSSSDVCDSILLSNALHRSHR